MNLYKPVLLSDPIQTYSSQSSPIKLVLYVQIHRYPSCHCLHSKEQCKVEELMLRLLTCSDVFDLFERVFREALFQGALLWLHRVAIKILMKVLTKAGGRVVCYQNVLIA